ncbi:ferritin heavy chain B-like [Anticarsia gemmatalis]|uniref:ferritin heavy chain B-like n=1 Tax=Anticarsia gemmatalis TaxID=129554 RepID=UPI003F75F119
MISHKLANLKKYSSIMLSNSRNSHCKYKYDSKIEDLVNRQIMMEQQAAQEYLNMAVVFLHPSKSQYGAGGFFMRMYQEELKHMSQFIHYQMLRGGKPLICGLEIPTEHKNLDLLEAFNHALAMEKGITEQIEEVIKVADEVKDYQCSDFLTSVFLAEQIESINEMAGHVTILTQLNKDTHALYHYDLELAKKYPYTFKTK